MLFNAARSATQESATMRATSKYDQRQLEVRLLELIGVARAWGVTHEQVLSALEGVLASEKRIADSKREDARSYL